MVPDHILPAARGWQGGESLAELPQAKKQHQAQERADARPEDTPRQQKQPQGVHDGRAGDQQAVGPATMPEELTMGGPGQFQEAVIFSKERPSGRGTVLGRTGPGTEERLGAE